MEGRVRLPGFSLEVAALSKNDVARPGAGAHVSKGTRPLPYSFWQFEVASNKYHLFVVSMRGIAC
jgi:hypothetical protein